MLNKVYFAEESFKGFLFFVKYCAQPITLPNFIRILVSGFLLVKYNVSYAIR